MDKLIFNQTGGWPLKTNRLDDMQNAWSIFNQLGYLGGDFTIVTGCVVAGANTGNGYVFIAGELYPFVGGATLSRVKIIEEKTAKEFENGENKDVVVKRKVVFTSSFSGSYSWLSFTRLKDMKTLAAEIASKAATSALNGAISRITALEKMCSVFVENGCIMPWGKPHNTIPAGWSEWIPGRGRTLIGMDVAEGADPDYGYGISGGAKTKNVSVTIPISGYGTGASADTGDSGKMLVSSGGHENEEFLESIRKAGNTQTVTGNVNVLSPYRIVEFIHYTG